MSEVSYQWNQTINGIIKGDIQINELEYFEQRTKVIYEKKLNK